MIMHIIGRGDHKSLKNRLWRDGFHISQDAGGYIIVIIVFFILILITLNFSLLKHFAQECKNSWDYLKIIAKYDR